MRATTKEQGFYSQIFNLVLPIVIQNLLSAAVNSADVVMLNYVGQSAISAVSLASNYANVLFMVYYGLGTGATLLCAQYFGKGNMRAIQTVEGIALRFSVIISVVVAGIAFTMPQMMMRLFTDNAELIRIGASYLRVMGVTYLCWGHYGDLSAVLRSLGQCDDQHGDEYDGIRTERIFNALTSFLASSDFRSLEQPVLQSQRRCRVSLN